SWSCCLTWFYRPSSTRPERREQSFQGNGRRYHVTRVGSWHWRRRWVVCAARTKISDQLRRQYRTHCRAHEGDARAAPCIGTEWSSGTPRCYRRRDHRNETDARVRIKARRCCSRIWNSIHARCFTLGDSRDVSRGTAFRRLVSRSHATRGSEGTGQQCSSVGRAHRGCRNHGRAAARRAHSKHRWTSHAEVAADDYGSESAKA